MNRYYYTQNNWSHSPTTFVVGLQFCANPGLNFRCSISTRSCLTRQMESRHTNSWIMSQIIELCHEKWTSLSLTYRCRKFERKEERKNTHSCEHNCFLKYNLRRIAYLNCHLTRISNWMIHVTHTNESRHTSECAGIHLSNTSEWVMSHMLPIAWEADFFFCRSKLDFSLDSSKTGLRQEYLRALANVQYLWRMLLRWPSECAASVKSVKQA